MKRKRTVQAAARTANSPDLVSPHDAQRLLGVSRTMVLKLADSGQLPVAMRLPNGTRIFRRSDVERLAAERAKK